jgi:hypothetical protein
VLQSFHVFSTSPPVLFTEPLTTYLFCSLSIRFTGRTISSFCWNSPSPQPGENNFAPWAKSMSQTTSVPISSTLLSEFALATSDRQSFLEVLSSLLSSASLASELSTVTSFGVVGVPSAALTTFFTPPSDCLNAAWTSNTSAYGALVCTRAPKTSCFPPGFLKSNNVLYSPGVCPKGYNPGTLFSTSITPMVTSCVCCPT